MDENAPEDPMYDGPEWVQTHFPEVSGAAGAGLVAQGPWAGVQGLCRFGALSRPQVRASMGGAWGLHLPLGRTSRTGPGLGFTRPPLSHDRGGNEVTSAAGGVRAVNRGMAPQRDPKHGAEGSRFRVCE